MLYTIVVFLYPHNKTDRRNHMKCKVCGAESGKYPLCWNCNILKEQGQIIKCTNCKHWHHKDASFQSFSVRAPRSLALELRNCFFRRYTKFLTS